MSVSKDVQLRDLDANGFKIENLAAGSAAADAVRFDQLSGRDMMGVSREPAKSVLLSAVETILDEFFVDFDEMTAANITAQLAAALLILAGAGTTTLNLYVGAAAFGSIAGGTLRATINHNGAETGKTNRGASFAKPVGGQIVQITMVNSLASVSGQSRGVEVNFRGA